MIKETRSRFVCTEKAALRLYSAGLLAGLFLMVVPFVHGATPSPGHVWTEIGDGTWQVVNTQTATRTFTFADADGTVLAARGSLAANTIPYGNGTTLLATSTAGVGGQVFGFSGGIPAWLATSTLSIAGQLIGIRVLTSGTSYTPTAGTNTVFIRLVSGGAGGGGATAAASAASAGAGGDAGPYAEKLFTNISGAASYTIQVGTGGTGGIAANGTGGSGTNSNFACPATCTGGAVTVTSFASAGSAGTGSGTTLVTAKAGTGGFTSGSDAGGMGGLGEYAVRLSGTAAVSGSGGSNPFGAGGAARTTEGVGSVGIGFGGGGGGAVSLSASGFAGGNGAPGVIVIYEFK